MNKVHRIRTRGVVLTKPVTVFTITLPEGLTQGQYDEIIREFMEIFDNTEVHNSTKYNNNEQDSGRG